MLGGIPKSQSGAAITGSRAQPSASASLDFSHAAGARQAALGQPGRPFLRKRGTGGAIRRLASAGRRSRLRHPARPSLRGRTILYVRSNHYIAYVIYTTMLHAAERRNASESSFRCVGGAKSGRMNSVALIDYGLGNVHSAAGALNEAARRAGLARFQIGDPDDPAAIRACRPHHSCPGVGPYADLRSQTARSPRPRRCARSGRWATRPLSRHSASACSSRRFTGQGGWRGTASLDPGIVDHITPALPCACRHVGAWNGLPRSPAPRPARPASAPIRTPISPSYAFTPAKTGRTIAATQTYGAPSPAWVAGGQHLRHPSSPGMRASAIGPATPRNFLAWEPF